MAIKEDGREQDDLPAGADKPQPETTASQFATRNADASHNILTEDEAERKGDFTALLRIRLANAAREASEHLDVNGDGFIAQSLSSGEADRTAPSLFYGQDEFGGYYAKDGNYHDKFGGYYDPFGYTAKDGSYTSAGGDHWDAETGKVTLASGEERPQTSEVVQQAIENDPTIARDQIKMDTQVAESRETEERKRRKQPSGKKKPKVNTAAAAQAAGAGIAYGAVVVTNDDREVSNIILETRIQEHRDTSKPATADEIQRANEEFLRKKGFIERARTRLSQQIADDATPDDKDGVAQRGDRPKFTAVSKEEASAKIKSMHVPAAAAKVTKATKATGATPGGDVKKPEDGATTATTGNTTADQKTDATAAAGSNWYADARGGYWDEFGGYYDKDGGYWEVDGGYWDKYNVYTDVNGGRTWPDGSYLDPKSNFVDKDGCYYMPDGAQIKPPVGMDFKKQMQEAAAKNETWHLPDELKPLLMSKVPAVDLNLKALAPISSNLASSLKPLDLTGLKTAPVTNVETPVKFDAVPLKLEPGKLGANLTLPPLKLDSGLGSPTAKGTGFSLLDPKQNSTPASAGNNFNVDTSRFQMCSTQGNPKNDFSSFFNNYHTFLTADKPASETKFYDLSNITLSPTIDTKTQLASLTTPAETKGTILSPKTVV